MNKIKFFFFICAILIANSVNAADLCNKIQLSNPSAVANKANEKQLINTSQGIGMQDPFMQGVMNGYYNMMQGMTGASYNTQEMQRQQADYASQQAKE